MERKLTLLEIAEHANRAAQDVIVKGSTQPEKSPKNDSGAQSENSLPKDYYRIHRMKGIGGEGERKALMAGKGEKEKEEIKKTVFGTRDEIEEMVKEKVESGQSSALAFYQAVIYVSKKYSLGNCYELAFQAFEDILNNDDAKDVIAKVFEIRNGDHVIVHLERKGEPSIILDPWSNLVCIEDKKGAYLARLKVHYRENKGIEDKYINKTAPFNAGKHSFSIITILDPETNEEVLLETTTIRKLKEEDKDKIKKVPEYVEKLIQTFSQERDRLINIVEKFYTNLEIEKNRLINKYHGPTENTDILQSKQNQMTSTIQHLREIDLDQLAQATLNSNLPPKEYIRGEVITKYNETINSINFLDEQLKKLFEPAEYKFAMNLFNKKSTTQENIEKIVDEFNTSLKKRT